MLLYSGVACSAEDKKAGPANANAAANAVETETAAVAGGESQNAAAEAVVADLYKQHDAKNSPFYQTKDRARVDKYFTKPFADLIWKYSKTVSKEDASFDPDPIYNTQDRQIKNFKVGSADVKGDAATVPVSFTNFAEKVTINFKLKMVSGSWKIDDIMYSPKDGLAAWLKDRLKALSENTETASTSGDFQGKYRVGDTNCTVTPVRQGYEVKWAKGSGSEFFLAKELTVFESEPDKNGGRNEFRFDDENYDSGTFVRADGKVFPISRAR